ncbi:MAG: GntR family transcriptional regulator [Deltaproteobacteria bacterium]|nr:GntR family transcriptional regulator [Deltaproteobacteria bacterium]
MNQNFASFQTLHQPLRMQVYEYLRNELKAGRLEPGMFVSTSKMMTQLGISRTPLREALLQLQVEGFVTLLPQRGIRINKLTQQDVEDIYEMLGALDSRAFLSVFHRLGPAQIREMERINEEMHKNLSDVNFNRYWDLNTAFHHTYLDLSPNKPLLNQLSILRQRMFEFGKKDWSLKMRNMNYQEHRMLIQMIEAGRRIEAADFIRDVHCIINY